MIPENQTPNEKIWYRQRVKNDAVQSATWAITPSSGVTLDDQTEGTDGIYGYTRIRVSRLSSGTLYELNVKLVTATGQEFERCTKIRCGPCCD